LVEGVHITAADIGDRAGALPLLATVHERFPAITFGWADQGYLGEFLTTVKDTLGITLAIVVRRDGGRRPTWMRADAPPREVPVFAVVPRRWVVERTFAWLGRNRRLVRDYEQLVEVSVATIYAAMTGLMLRRLARNRE
jgi:putative transposase